MKTNSKGDLQGRAEGLWHGWLVRLGGLVAGGLLCAAVLAPPAAKADANAPLTQLEYIRWLVKLADATSQFTPDSTAADYVQWARANGMNPDGGWDPAAPLTREVLAQTLVQFLGLVGGKTKTGTITTTTDFEYLLLREGIVLPSSQPQVTTAGFVSVIDEYGFQSVVGQKTKRKKTLVCPLPGEAPPGFICPLPQQAPTPPPPTSPSEPPKPRD